MTATLPTIVHEHHAHLLAHIDGMPAIGDSIGVVPVTELTASIDALAGFLEGTLIPHLDAAERAIYPELERLLQNQHSMTPMRREHEEARRHIAELAVLREQLDAARPSTRTQIALRRSIFGLYALLKVHLAEEELYVSLVGHGFAGDAVAAVSAALDHPMVPAP
jgi:iron-sulfur cluster repair protein YtfE (RIC family)